MTQAGAQKLIENTLKAKDDARNWRDIALVLADALAALDFEDIESDLEPYKSALKIAECIRDNDAGCVLDIIK